MENYRENIDKIDEEIKDLLLKRLKNVKEIGKIKKKRGIDILDKSREDYIINRLTSNLDIEETKYISNIYINIFKESKNIEDGR